MNTLKTKEDDAGVMYTISSGGITSYDIFTLAGKYRGGKIYHGDKKYIILSGRCELTMQIGGEDRISYLEPNDGIVEIPMGTPHIFYFPEDTRLIEWFNEGTASEHYPRYRSMKK